MRHIGKHLIIILFLIISGCEDEIYEVFEANVPIYISYDNLRNSIALEEAQTIQNAGKIHFEGDYLFINEYLKGIHIIDDTDSSNPQNIGFINIPGNTDISVKGNLMYVDSYVDLVVLDISNLSNITEVARIRSFFPYMLPPYDENYRIAEVDESKGIVVDWRIEEIKTKIDPLSFGVFPRYDEEIIYNSALNVSSVSDSSFGIGGSMSRFSIKDNALYSVFNYELYILDITEIAPVSAGSYYVSWQVETILSKDDYLFLGTPHGTIILNITDRFYPYWSSDYYRMTSCTPVIIADDYAFLTMRSGNACDNKTNQLDVIDLSNINYPVLSQSYSMTHPYGLGMDQNLLFVCDGESGLKVYDATDPLNLSNNLLVNHSDIISFNAIPYQNILFIIKTDGIYQYDYSDINNLQLLSVMPFVNET